MKKWLFVVLSLVVVSSTFAADTAAKGTRSRKIAQEDVKCGASVDEVVKQISASTACYDAMNVAKTCAYGSSADSQIVIEAQKICEKDFKKITKDDASLKAKMARRCESLCNPQIDGTMCISQVSFCKLSVTEYWSQFYHPESAL